MTRSASAAPTTPARRSSKLRLLDSLEGLGPRRFQRRVLIGTRGIRTRDCDLPLEDLAGRPLGQLVDEPDLARVLVAGDLLLDVRAQLVLGDVLAVLERDRGADLLAELVVRDADHRRLGHRGMLVEDLLDLARIDVVAAA